MKKDFHRGFTIVELIAVIAIVGVLIAILLPTVQYVRSSARNASCKNRIRQIAIGMLNYESAHASFPPGQLVTPHVPGSPGVDMKSLMIGHLGFVLPFIEQSMLQSAIKTDSWAVGEVGEPWYGDEILRDTVSKSQLAVFRCPTDTLGDMQTHLVSIQGLLMTSVGFNEARPGWSNYLGASGNDINAANYTNTGIFFANSETRFSHITDGSSNTLIIGEALGGQLPVFDGSVREDTMLDTRHSRLQNGIPGAFSFAPIKPSESIFNFSSLHGSHVNIALCDGSSRSLSGKTNSRILFSFITRNSQD